MPRFREIDSLYIVRAFAITAVVANHALTVSFAGGLNLLLLLSGIAFAQLCFNRQTEVSLPRAAVQFIRPLLIWSVVLCLFWFAVFKRFELAEMLMVSNWVTASRVSKFPIWYTQVMLQMMLAIVVLFQTFHLTPLFRRAPVLASAGALAAAAGLAIFAQGAFDSDDLKDKLPHLHAWNFVLGWLFWAVLISRQPRPGHQLLLTLISLPLLLFMFLGLDVPAADARAQVAILPAILLIWLPKIRLPFALVHPVSLISQATLYLFFLHYPFLLAVRNLLDGILPPDLVGFLQFGAAMIGPILIWAAGTATRRTLQEAATRRRSDDERIGALGNVAPADRGADLQSCTSSGG
ncbi:MAG: acyltransferase family protein [Pseudomonadota bacterium]